MIPQQTINRIIDTAQIVDVVSEFVTLRRRGVNYLGLCPFHADKSPSFNVSPSKNICKCFSCGEGGTPVGFLMKKEKMTFNEAIRWLGKKYGIEVEEKKLDERERREQTDREGMFLLNEFAQKTFEDDLFNHPEGRNVGLAYFRERGLNDETIHRYHLGYAIEDKYDLARRALQKGHKRQYLLDGTGVGLCYGNDPSKTPVCRFAGRVIFPHHSVSGKCIAFGGRILQRVDHAFKKYVNSPESLIYHKSDLPYGFYEAKDAISKADLCYVVEGNIDVLSMSQAGFHNVIAASGTAFTSDHIRIIKRFTRNCVLMFDADNAGIKAALSSIDLLLLEGMNVRLLLLPQGEDPDSFCRKHTSEEVAQYFSQQMQDFVTFKVRILMQGIAPNDPYAKANVAQNVANSVALVSDTITMSILVGQVSQLLNISERDVMVYVNKAKQDNYQAQVRQIEINIRREQARLEHEELGVQTPLPPTSPESDAAGPNAASAQLAPNAGSEAGTEDTTKKTEPIIPSSNYRFELSLLRQIVRHGGEYFNFSYINPDSGQKEEVQYRVIDFIYNELTNDGLTIQHPLYQRLYQLALDATADASVPWDSVRFYSNIYDDPEAQKLILELIQDRYEGMGIAQRSADLAVNVPRCVLELKDNILREQIKEIVRQLQTATDPEVKKQLMLTLSQKYQIQRMFDKELGERVINPLR